MLRQLSLFLGSTALAATLTHTTTAQEYSNGGTGQRARGPAIVSPVEAYGVHPPGPDPADTHGFCHRLRAIFTPYYAPLSPTATSVRWRPWCYFPVLPYYTPYYLTYGTHRLCNPKPPPYGFDGGWGYGPVPDGSGVAPRDYGIYSSVLQDDTVFWNLGGNGLVPYGAPRPPLNGPDIVSMIQDSRGGGSCQSSPGGSPPRVWNGGAAPAILPPTEKPGEK
jgi:hypothetical protein